MKLTIPETAKGLGLPLNTVERWIRQGKIPIRKVGDDCIFERTVLENWAKTHNLSFSLSQKKNQEAADAEPESLLAAMERGGVFYNIAGDDAETVLKAAVSHIPFLSQRIREELYEKLLEREGLTSTGIGKGIAVPHPRSPMSENLQHSVIITFFLEKPADFHAVDDRPVFVLFMLLSPSTQTHLHLLSKLAFCLRDEAFIKFLKTNPKAAELFSKIAEFEKQLDSSNTV